MLVFAVLGTQLKIDFLPIGNGCAVLEPKTGFIIFMFILSVRILGAPPLNCMSFSISFSYFVVFSEGPSSFRC